MSKRIERVVRELAPETLHHLIRQHGLDVCAEIVAVATPAQLTAVFDLDLWRSPRPGHDERFDTDRFGEWLELLVDAGGTVATRTVAAMDEHLVVAGLSRYLRVFDPGTFEPTESSDDEPADRHEMMSSETSPDVLECELGGYLVRARRTDTWDAIVALLAALEEDHQDRFHAVMRGCRRLSNSAPEVDGLDDLLTEPEQKLHDIAADRERRRERQGYGTPADSRAFLQMARQRRPAQSGVPPVNPIVAAYFRAVNETPAPDSDAGRDRPPQGMLAGAEAQDAILATLVEAGLVPPRPRALLEGAHAQPSQRTGLRTLLEYVHDHDEDLFFVRNQELAFLANALVAGCSIQSRAFTPQEGVDATVATCNLGLEHFDAPLPDTFLLHHDLVSVFEVGWSVLHEQVGLFAAGQLALALADLRCGDADIQEGLDALRFELTKQRKAGTPWRARPALDVIGMLDMPACAGVLGLLDECPVIPAALTAILEGRTGAISATGFEFISTANQLASVRAFMARFPDILR